MIRKRDLLMFCLGILGCFESVLAQPASTLPLRSFTYDKPLPLAYHNLLIDTRNTPSGVFGQTAENSGRTDLRNSAGVMPNSGTIRLVKRARGLTFDPSNALNQAHNV